VEKMGNIPDKRKDMPAERSGTGAKGALFLGNDRSSVHGGYRGTFARRPSGRLKNTEALSA
jgi:hypothetical protein